MEDGGSPHGRARVTGANTTVMGWGIGGDGLTVLQRVERHGGGVERLHTAHAPFGRPLYWTSVYRSGDVLVDSGSARGSGALARWLAARPVRFALTTHEHEDHVGGHGILAGCGCEGVFAPRRAVDLLERGPPRLPFYRWLTWGAHGRAPGARSVGERVDAGGRAFVAVPTPGHSTDHVVYLDEAASAVFSGDAFLGALRAVRAKEDVPEQMRSLRRLADLDPAVLYPTHGRILERPRATLVDVADRFDRLAARARALADAGRSTRRIRQDLLGAEPSLYWFSQGAFSAENLVRSLLGTPGTSDR